MVGRLTSSLSLSSLLRRKSSGVVAPPATTKPHLTRRNTAPNASSPPSTEAHPTKPVGTTSDVVPIGPLPDGHWDDLSREEKISQIEHCIRKICQKNWDTRDYQSTRFDAIYVPDISVNAYLTRIWQYCQLEDSTFLVAMVLLKRLFEAQGDAYLPTIHNTHRLLITAILVASKIHEDAQHSNRFIAKVGGVHLPELNKMELDFCVGIQWNMCVSDMEFSQAAAALQDFAAPEKTSFWNCWWRKAAKADHASSGAMQADCIGTECIQLVSTDLQTNLTTANRLDGAIGG